MLGSANHLLITAIVGLDGIKNGIITQPPKDFPATWNPKDPSASASRSRNLILEMCLVRSVDALDTYISCANRKPFLIQSSDIKSGLDGAESSVSKRFQVIQTYYSPQEPILNALIATLINWRNKAVHSEDTSKLKSDYVDILKQEEEEISNKFCGLDVKELLQGYNNNRHPRLKEVTSFINACHQYVRTVDGKILAGLEVEEYLREAIWKGIYSGDGKDNVNEREIKQLIKNKWNTNLSRRKKAIEGFLKHRGGFSDTKPAANEPYAVFDDNLLENCVFNKSHQEIYDWISPH